MSLVFRNQSCLPENPACVTASPSFRALSSRSGRKVDYKFYNPLEQILGQEAVSLDEYDEKDEQADQDAGAVAALDAYSALKRDDPSVSNLPLPPSSLGWSKRRVD